MRGLLLILIGLLTAASHANAQRGMPVARFAPGRVSISSRSISSQSFHNAVPFFSSPFFTDSFYYDELLGSGYPVASQPPLIIMQAAPAASAVPQAPRAPAEALLIELQGDHYVRLSGADSSGSEMIDHGLEPAVRNDATALVRGSVPEATVTVLVFRDGHHEEIGEYSIANGFLYANGAFYADGSPNKKIELSMLNLPETLDANRSRSIPFRLPKAANEVIVGP